MKLYEVPRGSKMLIEMEDKTMHVCLFHHVDGMYSYCTVEDMPAEGNPTFHLGATTEMKLVGDHYEIDTDFLKREAEEKLKQQAEENKIKVIDAMETYGGSFVKDLAECFRRADPQNFAKLAATFSEYWEQYEVMAKEKNADS